MRFNAENYWNHWRAFWRPGDSARIDRLLQETRTSLDELAEEMRNTRPDDWADHQLVWTEIDAADRDAEITEALEEYAVEEVEDEKDETVEHADTEKEEATEQAEAEERARLAAQAEQGGNDNATADDPQTRLDAVDKTLTRFENLSQSIDKSLSRLTTTMEHGFSSLHQDLESFRNDFVQQPQAKPSRGQPSTRADSDLRLVARTNFEVHVNNEVGEDHPAYNVAVISGIDDSIIAAFPTAHGFYTAEGQELARIDDQGRVYDMTPRNTLIGSLDDIGA